MKKIGDKEYEDLTKKELIKVKKIEDELENLENKFIKSEEDYFKKTRDLPEDEETMGAYARKLINDLNKRNENLDKLAEVVGLANGGMPEDEDEEDSYRAGVMQAMAQSRKKAMGGGMMQIPMGKMRMNEGGVIERDYRDKGGFVPVGIKEKADDVPAMLSKNEFVMTADAVRGAGGGSIEKGAQRMYDTMKSLERKIG